MARASSHDVILLEKRRRKRLERITARASSPQHLVPRAKIVLAAWRRQPNAKIARDLGIRGDTIRKRATRPARAGHTERHEFEYVRHGTVSLIATMNVTTDTVHPKIITRNDSDTFIEFLTELAQTIDPTKKIHLILDNSSSHTSQQTRK